MKPGSQTARLLDWLSDGEWWTTSELLYRVPCIVHSRIAELRKQGYRIEHETTGPGASGSRYRLVQFDAEPERPPGLTHPDAAQADRQVGQTAAPVSLGPENGPSAPTPSATGPYPALVAEGAQLALVVAA